MECGALGTDVTLSVDLVLFTLLTIVSRWYRLDMVPRLSIEAFLVFVSHSLMELVLFLP